MSHQSDGITGKADSRTPCAMCSALRSELQHSLQRERTLRAQLDATFAEGVRLRGELDAETAERVRQQAAAEGK